MIPSEVFTAQALFTLVVSMKRLSNTLPPSAYQFSFGGSGRGPAGAPFAAPPPGAPFAAPPFAAPGPAGEFAVDTGPIVAGQAKPAAPLLFEFNSAMAAALCAVPVSAVCPITVVSNIGSKYVGLILIA